MATLAAGREDRLQEPPRIALAAMRGTGRDPLDDPGGVRLLGRAREEGSEPLEHGTHAGLVPPFGAERLDQGLREELAARDLGVVVGRETGRELAADLEHEKARPMSERTRLGPADALDDAEPILVGSGNREVPETERQMRARRLLLHPGEERGIGDGRGSNGGVHPCDMPRTHGCEKVARANAEPRLRRRQPSSWPSSTVKSDPVMNSA